MILRKLYLKNFRCFEETTILFNKNISVIKGINGVGKTSLLEAIHYLCYLHSFRTYVPTELVQFQKNGFFISANLYSSEHVVHELHVGFFNQKKRVRLDEKSLGSYKDLFYYCRVITLTEDDIELIKGTPTFRRSYIDRVVLLNNPDFLQQFRHYKKTVDQRNALLLRGNCKKDVYSIWTKQLLAAAQNIQQARINVLEELQTITNTILHEHFDNDSTVNFSYKIKTPEAYSLEYCMDHMYAEELRHGRTLFGAHLDDITIIFCGIKSKKFASRGQQKLIVLLIKIAQLKQLAFSRGSAIFLLDDFMTDFDARTIETLLSVLLDMGNQLIFTTPLGEGEGVFTEKILSLGAEIISLA